MSAREEIEAMLARREEAMAAGNVDALMEFYTDDYELVARGLPVVSGRESVRALFASMFQESLLRPRLVVEDLRVQGTLGVMYARELLTLHEREDGSESQVAMHHMASLCRTENVWKFSRSMLMLHGPGVAEESE